jgi:hypothetical protein
VGPDNKADNSKIATNRSVTVSGASVKNKVAAKTEAVSKADDKRGSFETTKRRELIPVALL